jgi:hypothetical protein
VLRPPRLRLFKRALPDADPGGLGYAFLIGIGPFGKAAKADRHTFEDHRLGNVIAFGVGAGCDHPLIFVARPFFAG